MSEVSHKAVSPMYTVGHFPTIGEVVFANDVARFRFRRPLGWIDIVSSGTCFLCHQAAPWSCCRANRWSGRPRVTSNRSPYLALLDVVTAAALH